MYMYVYMCVYVNIQIGYTNLKCFSKRDLKTYRDYAECYLFAHIYTHIYKYTYVYVYTYTFVQVHISTH